MFSPHEMVSRPLTSLGKTPQTLSEKWLKSTIRLRYSPPEMFFARDKKAKCVTASNNKVGRGKAIDRSRKFGYSTIWIGIECTSRDR